jgi:hypothetical protein
MDHFWLVEPSPVALPPLPIMRGRDRRTMAKRSGARTIFDLNILPAAFPLETDLLRQSRKFLHNPLQLQPSGVLRVP